MELSGTPTFMHWAEEGEHVREAEKNQEKGSNDVVFGLGGNVVVR